MLLLGVGELAAGSFLDMEVWEGALRQLTQFFFPAGGRWGEGLWEKRADARGSRNICAVTCVPWGWEGPRCKVSFCLDEAACWGGMGDAIVV